MNLNLAPPFPMDQTKEKEHDENQETFTFGLNHHHHHHHHQIVSSSSSSSASCHIFFNQAQDHAGFFNPQLYQPHHQDEYYSYHGGSSYQIENKVERGLKLSLWKKEEENTLVKESSSSDGVKWLMKKKKKRKKKDEEGISMMNGCSAKMEVKKVKQSSSMETDLSSNSSSYNCSTPIRVCSDCHTTKTPLWRSGPKGPKSLCNACGIRQRKARRAMAAAAAAAGDGGGGVACDPMKVKVKVKMGKSGMKKRCKSGGELEEFLIRLSEKLAIHRVFPQDEKEAAILLMALSSGLVHG